MSVPPTPAYQVTAFFHRYCPPCHSGIICFPITCQLHPSLTLSLHSCPRTCPTSLLAHLSLSDTDSPGPSLSSSSWLPPAPQAAWNQQPPANTHLSPQIHLGLQNYSSRTSFPAPVSYLPTCLLSPLSTPSLLRLPISPHLPIPESESLCPLFLPPCVLCISTFLSLSVSLYLSLSLYSTLTLFLCVLHSLSHSLSVTSLLFCLCPLPSPLTVEILGGLKLYCPAFESRHHHSPLWDFGQVTFPVGASVSTSVKWASWQLLPPRLW